MKKEGEIIIKTTFFHMQDLKASGPNGFLVLFYKEYWPIVGDTIIKAMTSFFEVGSMPKEINSSLIVLIPKLPSPTSFNNYRPISLCNVVYKIISKLLVSKMRPLLHKLISPCQSTLIPGRWIVEDQVVVQELLYSFKTRKIKVGQMAIKLDMQKAYDRVSWKFLQVVLRNFGFSKILLARFMPIYLLFLLRSWSIVANQANSNQVRA